MNVLGVDYSSHFVDFVTVPIDDGPPHWVRHTLRGNDAFDRTRTVAAVLPGRHNSYWDDIVAIGIEHPAGKHGVGPLLRVQGSILACIPARMLVVPLPPGKWRKLVGLPGNASKQDVRSWVLRNGFDHGWKTDEPTLEQDACDAYCIALATRTLLAQQQKDAA